MDKSKLVYVATLKPLRFHLHLPKYFPTFYKKMKKLFLFAVVIFFSCQNQPKKTTHNGSESDNNGTVNNETTPNAASDQNQQENNRDENSNAKDKNATPGKSIADPEIIKGTPLSPGKKGSLNDTAMESPVHLNGNSGSGGQSSTKGGTSTQSGNLNNNIPGQSNHGKELGNNSTGQPSDDQGGNKAGLPGSAAGLPGQSGHQPGKTLPPDSPSNNNETNSGTNNSGSQNPQTGKTNNGNATNNSGTPAKNYGNNKGGLSDTADEAPKSPAAQQGPKTSTGKTTGTYSDNKGALSDTADESPQKNQRTSGRGRSIFSQRNYAGDKGALKDTAQESPKPLPPQPLPPPPPAIIKKNGQTSASNAGTANQNAVITGNVIQKRRQTLAADSTPNPVPAASRKINSPVKTIQKRIP